MDAEPPERYETPKERVDRELIELLNELRVVLPGVTVLLAFLLAVPFAKENVPAILQACTDRPAIGGIRTERRRSSRGYTSSARSCFRFPRPSSMGRF